MRVLMVANPKGGVGKSTLATNLAGMLAHRSLSEPLKVMLGDVDRQQSSRQWLALRPREMPKIYGWELDPNTLAKPPKGTTHAVVDTPAGLHGEKLKGLLKRADAILVPVQPSLFDILATRTFLDDLLELRAAKGISIALVGMRVDARTRAAETLHQFTDSVGLPVLAWLRNTQNYVQLAERGLTLFDVAPGRVEKDLAQWGPIDRWVRLIERQHG